MRVGVDFDNTIVSYDALFHKVACEKRLVPVDLPGTKIAVRDWLREEGKETAWTELQGYVYGARMDEAEPYPGVVDFFVWARARSIATYIISHRTAYPIAGPRYDLHKAARLWIDHHLAGVREGALPPENVYFELGTPAKLRRIGTVGCAYYIDDLPEILLSADFPAGPKRILFDPESHHLGACNLIHATSWHEIRSHIGRECVERN
jgi:hypothetical protein